MISSYSHMELIHLTKILELTYHSLQLLLKRDQGPES